MPPAIFIGGHIDRGKHNEKRNRLDYTRVRKHYWNRSGYNQRMENGSLIHNKIVDLYLRLLDANCKLLTIELMKLTRRKSVL